MHAHEDNVTGPQAVSQMMTGQDFERSGQGLPVSGRIDLANKWPGKKRLHFGDFDMIEKKQTV